MVAERGTIIWAELETSGRRWHLVCIWKKDAFFQSFIRERVIERVFRAGCWGPPLTKAGLVPARNEVVAEGRRWRTKGIIAK